MNAPIPVTPCESCGFKAPASELYDSPDDRLVCGECLNVMLDEHADEPDHDARETFERDHAANRGGAV